MGLWWSILGRYVEAPGVVVPVGCTFRLAVVVGVERILLRESFHDLYDEVAEQKISVMIDALCDASKVLNTKTAEKK